MSGRHCSIEHLCIRLLPGPAHAGCAVCTRQAQPVVMEHKTLSDDGAHCTMRGQTSIGNINIRGNNFSVTSLWFELQPL